MSLILSNHDTKHCNFKNRLAVAPMTRVTATKHGVPTEAMRDYYRRFAQGGFGLVIAEGLYTDKAFSQGYHYQPGLATDEQAAGWALITGDAHEHGALMFAQIMHSGALNQGNESRDHSVAPSPVKPVGKQMTFYYGKDDYPTPQAITDTQIQEVIQGFADTAVRAVTLAHFDGIEIHGAFGYLLDQFLTDYTNLRDDEWGGDVHGRVKLIVEVVKAVKSAVGRDVPVGIRISQSKVNDFHHKWAGAVHDAEVIFSAIEQAGADFIHIGEFEAWQPAFDDGAESLVTLARRFAPNLTIIANGNLHHRARAEEVLTAGADLVAIGRWALSNPDLPKLWEAGKPLREFDSSVLEPIANIKPSELEFTGS